ncbi:hypothetical protein V8D89_003338 [Ganoderma adspersum]
MASTPVGRNIPGADAVADRDQNEVKEIMRDYLKRSMTPSDDSRLAEAYQSRDRLYQDIFDTVLHFIKAAGDDSKLAERLSAFGADLAGIIYPHTSPEHQRYIALYTACMTYADDLGSRHVEALAQFSRRFATGQKQLSPPLEFLADLLRKSYDLWPEVGADTIISSTLIAITAMHVECTAGNVAVIPKATWWPNYFRTRTGFSLPYAHFSFVKGWRSTTDSYMQLLPYLEFFLNSSNDVLSFYKEELSGETANYVHIRATTDEMTPVETLRLLADETLACEEKIRVFIGEDHELMAIWRSLEQGFLAFHMKTPRYRLMDLTISEND